MTTVTKQATSDLSNTGGFTTAPLFSKINDSSDATFIVGVTNTGGRATFGFSAFSLPTEAVVSSVDIHYRHRSTTTGTAYAHGSCVKVGATYYGRGQTAGWDAGQASGVGSGSPIADRIYQGTVNPATGIAWSAAEVNALTEFGVSSGDFNPDANFYQVDITVNYTLTYNETGKAQVILAVQAKSDNQAMVEAGKAQVVLTAQSRLDTQVVNEAGRTQVVLVAQVETDGFLFDETGRSQVVLVAQAKADVQSMAELDKSQVVLTVQSQIDIAQMNELNRAEVILAIQTRSDTQVSVEALAQTILVAQAETDDYLPGGGGDQEEEWHRKKVRSRLG